MTDIDLDSELEKRKNLTFEQAEGLAPLPSQLNRDEVSRQLKARLFEIVFDSIKRFESKTSDDILPPWSTILKNVFVRRDGNMADQFDPDVHALLKWIRRNFEGDYAKLYGFLQWILRHPECPRSLPNSIARILDEEHAAFRLVDNDTFMPIASEFESQALQTAISDSRGVGIEGGRKHLKEAAAALNEGRFADSVRESIHAVESVARILAQSDKLSDALSKLAASTHIHKAMKSGFGALYGFSSDENGIRHPLLEEGDAKVDETDAIFMLGACAAFVSYLISKGRKAGII